jgi:hypothetical protein
MLGLCRSEQSRILTSFLRLFLALASPWSSLQTTTNAPHAAMRATGLETCARLLSPAPRPHISPIMLETGDIVRVTLLESHVPNSKEVASVAGTLPRWEMDGVITLL